MAEAIDPQQQLLQQEYLKLQNKYHEIKTKYSAITASSPGDTFASRLLALVSTLHDSETNSDIKIVLKDKTINAHKLVLNARSDLWNEAFLAENTELDWTEIEPEVAEMIILWLYTSKINLSSEDGAERVIRKAFDFKLDSLVESCEQYLISIVSFENCVKFSLVAVDVGAENLKEYCTGLISAHWDDFNASDFEHMPGALLDQIQKCKKLLALHLPIKDVKEKTFKLSDLGITHSLSVALFKYHSEVLKKLSMDSWYVQKFLIKENNIKKWLLSQAQSAGCTTVKFEGIEVKMMLDDHQPVKGFTFAKFCAALALSYYNYTVKGLSDKDVLERNFIIPSPLEGVPDTHNVAFFRMYSLGCPGAHLLPRLLWEMDGSKDSTDNKEIGGMLTICALIDYIAYHKTNRSVKVSFGEYVFDKETMETRTTFAKAVRNMGTNAVKSISYEGLEYMRIATNNFKELYRTEIERAAHARVMEMFDMMTRISSFRDRRRSRRW